MLWVARDDDTCLAVFYGEPRLKFGIWVAQSDRPFDFLSIDSSKFPDLAPGECRELRMVEPVDEGKEREAFDRWHQARYGWTWDGDISPDMGEDERARARWVAWKARAEWGEL